MKAFWKTKDWSQKHTSFGAVFTKDKLLMLHSILNFPENGGVKVIEN